MTTSKEILSTEIWQEQKVFSGKLGQIDFYGMESFLDGLMERARITDEIFIYEISMAVTEAVENIFEHAYEGKEGDVTYIFEKNPEKIIINLIDFGKSFDPEKVPQVGIPKNLEEVNEMVGHGLGLPLMKKIMDKVEYEFGEEGNKITLTRFLNGVGDEKVLSLN